MLTDINAHSNKSAVDKVFKRNKTSRNTKPGMTKNAVINAFNGLHFSHAQWHMYLANPPQWLKVCRIDQENKKMHATWNPILIALALLNKGISEDKLDDVFGNLKDWAEEWKAESA